MTFETRSNIPVKETYWPSDCGMATEQDHAMRAKLGAPGEFPFTRGPHKNMYRGKLWTMRQYAGFGTAEESNARYKYLLSQGTTGLSVAFDLPTQLGLDPDHTRSQGEVGRVGVSIATIDDMRMLFDGIDLAQISTSMTINATAPVLLALYIALAEERGVKPSILRGTVQNDVLKEYIARGNYIYPAHASLRLAGDLIEFCMKHVPKWNPISISGYHIREAGATAVEELAFTFSNAIAYVEEMTRRGLSADAFGGQLSFFFNVHSDFFEEIAKFRAARRIWARIMSDRFGSKNPEACMLRFHAQTAGSTLAAQQPDNNIVRVSLQALSAVLAGAQSLHTNARDEAIGLPTEDSAQLALRTQQVIAHESNVTQTVDPLGGSWFIESLTDEIERRTLALMQEIDSQGGTVRCIESGFIQSAILTSACLDQNRIDSGELKVIGVNCFKEGSVQADTPVHKVPPGLEQKACERIAQFRKKRNPSKYKKSLEELSKACSGNENLFGLILEAIKHHATLGEISDTLRGAMGEFRPSA